MHPASNLAFEMDEIEQNTAHNSQLSDLSQDNLDWQQKLSCRVRNTGLEAEHSM